MNKVIFEQIAKDIQSYKGTEVDFVHFIPSANKEVVTRGFISGVGKSGTPLAEEIVVSSRGIDFSIHYSKVNICK